MTRKSKEVGDTTQAEQKQMINIDKSGYQKIKAFLTKKRRLILQILYMQGELSHGELAKVIGTSVASLSNMLARIEEFGFKLLNSRSDGKYRYYFLSGIGYAYMEQENKLEDKQQNGEVIRHGIMQYFARAKEALEKYQEEKEDGWELAFDDALIRRINPCKIVMSEEEELIDTFLYNIEAVYLEGDENYFNKVTGLLAERTLQGRLSRFIDDRFMVFCPLLRAWKEQSNILHIYKMLERIIWQDDVLEQYDEQILSKSLYDKLTDVMRDIMQYLTDEDEMGVQQCFEWYLIGEKRLSAFISYEIGKKNKKENLSL